MHTLGKIVGTFIVMGIYGAGIAVAGGVCLTILILFKELLGS